MKSCVLFLGIIMLLTCIMDTNGTPELGTDCGGSMVYLQGANGNVICGDCPVDQFLDGTKCSSCTIFTNNIRSLRRWCKDIRYSSSTSTDQTTTTRPQVTSPAPAVETTETEPANNTVPDVEIQNTTEGRVINSDDGKGRNDETSDGTNTAAIIGGTWGGAIAVVLLVILVT